MSISFTFCCVDGENAPMRTATANAQAATLGEHKHTEESVYTEWGATGRRGRSMWAY